MDKRYQVFVSSTYIDLKDVRQNVIRELMGLRFMPVGMEFFPASDESQWELIQRIIRDCDYYVVIIGGRYGSVDETGVSYTEKEYRLAVDMKIPTLAYIHEDSAELAESDVGQTDDDRQKLAEFRAFCKSGKVFRPWNDADRLPALVHSDMLHQLQVRPAVGWVRADQLNGGDSPEMVRTLQEQNAELKTRLAQLEGNPVNPTVGLVHGEEMVEIPYLMSYHKAGVGMERTGYLVLNWNRVFGYIAPFMLDWIPEVQIEKFVGELVRAELRDSINKNGLRRVECQPSPSSMDRILTRFSALGLIGRQDDAPYWCLSKHGRAVLAQLP